jgi:hypothetical protein
LAEDIRLLRTGKRSEKAALAWAEWVEETLESRLERSRLPDHPDMREVEEWLTKQYRLEVLANVI